MIRSDIHLTIKTAYVTLLLNGAISISILICTNIPYPNDRLFFWVLTYCITVRSSTYYKWMIKRYGWKSDCSAFPVLHVVSTLLFLLATSSLLTYLFYISVLCINFVFLHIIFIKSFCSFCNHSARNCSVQICILLNFCFLTGTLRVWAFFLCNVRYLTASQTIASNVCQVVRV